MHQKIGIVKEKKPWEKRTALTPENVKYLKDQTDSTFYVEEFEDRCFSAEEYKEAGAELTNNLGDCDIILGVKEIESKYILPQKTYLFFPIPLKAKPQICLCYKKLWTRKAH